MKPNKWKSCIGVALAVSMTAGLTFTPLNFTPVLADTSIVSQQGYGGPVIQKDGQVTFYYQGDGLEQKVRVKGSWAASWDQYFEMTEGVNHLWSVTTTGLDRSKSYEYGIEVQKTDSTEYTWAGDPSNPCTTGNSRILRNPQMNEDGSVRITYYPEGDIYPEMGVRYRKAGSETAWEEKTMSR
ncbi:MAG TPA: hypothetical protein IAC62_11435, partial [Candidatus Pelethocola excrementipullorum]|nr:hypothetical protein [Candidatus Pelethocola excrementipullorum]